MGSTSNPGLYRRLCLPHESIEAAHAAMTEFCDAAKALREMHRVPDVVIICSAHAMREGNEVEIQASLQLGNYEAHELMIARSLGQIRADRQAEVAAAIQVPQGGE